MSNPTTWLAPPEPTGLAGTGQAGGYTATGLTNTELGDAVEAALIAQLGFASALQGRRQGAIDCTYGEYAVELAI
jgi:hypothetical protein